MAFECDATEQNDSTRIFPVPGIQMRLRMIEFRLESTGRSDILKKSDAQVVN